MYRALGEKEIAYVSLKYPEYQSSTLSKLMDRGPFSKYDPACLQHQGKLPWHDQQLVVFNAVPLRDLHCLEPTRLGHMHNLRVPHPVDQDEQLLVAWNNVVEPTHNEMVKKFADIMRTTQPPCSNLHLSEIAGFINCAFPTHIECDPDSCITMFLDLAPQTIGGELSQWWGEPAPWDAWCEHQSVGAGLWAVYWLMGKQC